VIKREINRKLTYECRCDERLEGKDEGSIHLDYTGLCGGLEHLKIETRLIDEDLGVYIITDKAKGSRGDTI